MATRIQIRRGTAAQWAAANPILANGEPGIATDTGEEKIGDGATAWADLPVRLSGYVQTQEAANSQYAAFQNQLEQKTSVTVDDLAVPTLVVSTADLRGAANGIASLGADGKVPNSQLPVPSQDPDAWLGYASTTFIPNASGTTVITSGRVWYTRVTQGKKDGATKVACGVNVASGNIMVGVYRASGTGPTAKPGSLVANSAVTPLTDTGYVEVALGTSVNVYKGDYLALWCDNLTATFTGQNPAGSAALTAQGGYIDAGSAATALPADGTAITAAARYYFLYAV